MDFLILGPVEVRANGRQVALGGPKQRATLALMLLNANRVLSRDWLIDRLWDGAPPPTAATALHGHVSGLRKALGADVIQTRSPGYVLEVEPGRIDLTRFEELRGDARRALDRGDPGKAAAQLRSALDLWRGEALADVRLEPALEQESERLDDLRLTAIEDRIDADLAAGGAPGGLVAELEGLLAAHPLRERLWGQLMLALYRSGRQADALDAYRRARHRLIAQLGIEPSQSIRDLERSILAQDPALDPPPRSVGGGGPRRRRALLALVALALVAVVAGVALASGGGSGAPSVPQSGLAVVDADSGELVDAIPLDIHPDPVTAGAGGVWALDLGAGTLARIDPRSRKLVRTSAVQGSPGSLAASDDDVWISDGCADGGHPGVLLRVFTKAGGGTSLDSDSTELEPAFEDGPPALQSLQGETACGLAAAGDTVWATTNLTPGVVRADLDRGSGETAVALGVRLPRPPPAIAVGVGSVWVADGRADVVWRLHPRSGRVLQEVPVGSTPASIAVGSGSVWVANRDDGSVSRIDPRSSTVSKVISVGDSPVALAAGGESVWVANRGDGSLSRIDPSANRVAATVDLGRAPRGVALAGGAVWVTVRP